MDIFAQALTVKADSVLNIEDYEMAIYPTQFDKTTMTVQTKEGVRITGSHCNVRKALQVVRKALQVSRKALQVVRKALKVFCKALQGSA